MRFQHWLLQTTEGCLEKYIDTLAFQKSEDVRMHEGKEEEASIELKVTLQESELRSLSSQRSQPLWHFEGHLQHKHGQQLQRYHYAVPADNDAADVEAETNYLSFQTNKQPVQSFN